MNNIRSIQTVSSGFTLVETIITIIVFSLLASMVIPTVSGYFKLKRAEAVVKNLKYIAKAEDLYYENNTKPYSCSAMKDGISFTSIETFHLYTSSFLDLVSSGYLGYGAKKRNFFGYGYILSPVYSSVSVNADYFCIREAGIKVETYIPEAYSAVVGTIPGAFDVSASGGVEEIGYYAIPKENNPEEDLILKYNR